MPGEIENNHDLMEFSNSFWGSDLLEGKLRGGIGSLHRHKWETTHCQPRCLF